MSIGVPLGEDALEWDLPTRLWGWSVGNTTNCQILEGNGGKFKDREALSRDAAYIDGGGYNTSPFKEKY